ncbi:retrovirus-related Pol polyprotein from transposon TNT 1-94, partial [Trifolium pratense]
VRNLPNASLLLSQTKYSLNLLTIGSMQNVNGISSPMFIATLVVYKCEAVIWIVCYLEVTVSCGLLIQPVTPQQPMVTASYDAYRVSSPDHFNITEEVMWIQTLLKEIQIPFTMPVIYCDNLNTVFLSHNLVLHSGRNIWNWIYTMDLLYNGSELFGK